MVLTRLFLPISILAVFGKVLTTDEINCSQPLPWGCTCHGPPNLDCSFKGIEALNDTALLPLAYSGLSFAHNQLKNLTAGTMWMMVRDNLKELDLSFNDVMWIEDGVFQDLNNLRTLHLHHNLLRNISSHTWTGLTSLEYLDLSFNRMRNVPSDIFAPLDHLRHLILRYNPLLKLNGFLSPLHALKHLDLDTTGLAKLSSHVFSNTSLLTLHLSGNVFTEVPTKSFSTLRHLTYLDLSDNHFEIIRTQAFHSLGSVERLIIDKSYTLKAIEQNAFDGMKSLKEVSCSFNPHLETVHAQAFQSVNSPQGVYEGNLEEVHLRQNALTTLDQNLLPWMRIVNVDLRDNPWNCDCHISWLRKMMWVKITERTSIKCNSPPSLHDRPIQEVDIDDFICDEAHHDALTSIILFLTLFAVVVFILSLISCWKLKAFSKCQAAYQMQYRRVGKSSTSEAPVEKLELDEAQDL